MIRGDNENLNYSEEVRGMYCIPHPQQVTTKSKLQARWNMAGEGVLIKQEDFSNYGHDLWPYCLLLSALILKVFSYVLLENLSRKYGDQVSTDRLHRNFI